VNLLPHSDTELLIATVKLKNELLINACNLDLHILLFLYKNARAMRMWKHSVVQLEPIIAVQFGTVRFVTVLVLWPDVRSFGIS